MTRIPNLDLLLNSKNINDSIISIDVFICELCKYGEQLQNLTEPQKFYFFNQTLEREVNNGGFDQYFSNASNAYAYETITSLKAIGADKTADILQQAIDLVLQLIKKGEEVQLEVWNDLDERFLRYQDDLNSLNMNFVKENSLLF